MLRLLGLAAALLLVEPAHAGGLDPGSTLCLLPVALPVEDGDGSRQARIEARLKPALAVASFEVVDSKPVSAAWERVLSEAGARFDPITGRPDRERNAALEAQLTRTLREELRCDALLSPSVAVVQAAMYQWFAAWDGTEERVVSAGRIFLEALAGVNRYGWVTALSLRLRVVDLDDRELAYRSAGIESLASLSVTHGEDVLPADVWLTDVEKIDAAIQSALGPGGRALRTEGTPEEASR